MDFPEIGFGLIGTGMIAPKHAQAILATPGARLVAALGTSAERTNRFAAEYGIAGYTDLAAFLAHPGLDVVNICVPSGEHARFGIAAARAGKHVMVEKPVEVTLEAADRLIEACRKAGVKLAVISQRRFEPDIQRLRTALQAGYFGKLISADVFIKWYRSQEYYDSAPWRGTYRLDGGGALMNQGVHYVDVLQWLVGQVKSVRAITRTAAHEIEVEDLALALLTFENGAVGLLEASTAHYPGLPERLEITGLNGTAVLEAGKFKVWEFKNPPEETQAKPEFGLPGETGARNADDITYRGHAYQIADMVAAIREGREPAITGEAARKPLEIIQAIYQSARENREIFLV
ncbi:MAG TPA: Gfo/Idh/MocA family oxidoreductase [Chloroflexia bacterium]|nr:Gfo/Idh/MocA family oxidoreductase [Chloroflexia bacterium]